MSNFAILRVQKLKSRAEVRRSIGHAFRTKDTPNADPARGSANTHFGATTAEHAIAKFDAAMPEKVRSNAVVCVEYLVTASPEAMHGKTRQQQDDYFKDALRWIAANHGGSNLVYAGVHRDETTPHLYCYVVPKDDKGRLNCRAFLGGAKALVDMQSDFAEKVGQPHGLVRGQQHSKARHTSVRQWYAQIEPTARKNERDRAVIAETAQRMIDEGDKMRAQRLAIKEQAAQLAEERLEIQRLYEAMTPREQEKAASRYHDIKEREEAAQKAISRPAKDQENGFEGGGLPAPGAKKPRL